MLLLKCLADNEEGYLDSKRKVRRTDICTFYDKFDSVLCIYIDTFVRFKNRFLRNKAIKPGKMFNGQILAHMIRINIFSAT